MTIPRPTKNHSEHVSRERFKKRPFSQLGTAKTITRSNCTKCAFLSHIQF